MKQKVMKFAGPSKKMMEALENEGLVVDWPVGCPPDGEALAMDGFFYNGGGVRKSLFIDLRGKDGLERKSRVDRLVAEELAAERDNFDVDEEFEQAMNKSELGRSAVGKPLPTALMRDLREEESRLKRFAEVAEAVADGSPVPPKARPSADEETVHITPQMARDIVGYLKIAYPMMNNLGKSDFAVYINTLNRKMGIEEQFKG